MERYKKKEIVKKPTLNKGIITSSVTAITASQINGITVNSLFNLGINNKTIEQSIDSMSSTKKNYIRKAKIIIIVEFLLEII